MWLPTEFWTILKKKAKIQGVTGFSGQCGQLAFCAKEKLYPDAEVVGAFNKSLHDGGRMWGHVFLYKNGTYFDAAQASQSIEPFLPLTKLSYQDKKINPIGNDPTRLMKQNADSLIILRHMRRPDGKGLSTQFRWVCDIF